MLGRTNPDAAPQWRGFRPMDKTEELIDKTETLLHQIETLQQSITSLQAELKAHNEHLGEQLGRLRKKAPALAQLRPLTTAERRSTPRRKGNPVSVYISNGTTGSEPFQGWVVDRSAGGLRLLVDEPMQPGHQLTVRPVKVHASFPWVQVKVKNCYPERKSWCVGCQFVHRLAWDDLQHFG
jgi:hypothetical protein